MIHQDLMAFLEDAKNKPHVGVVVLTAGLTSIWTKMLGIHCLSDTAFVIGRGQASNGFVVTPEVKRAIVARLQQRYQTFVYVFGDSEVDVPMLKQADEAIVVVHDSKESDSINGVLNNAIKMGELRAKQMVFGDMINQRLDEEKLPYINLATSSTKESIEWGHERGDQVHGLQLST